MVEQPEYSLWQRRRRNNSALNSTSPHYTFLLLLLFFFFFFVLLLYIGHLTPIAMCRFCRTDYNNMYGMSCCLQLLAYLPKSHISLVTSQASPCGIVTTNVDAHHGYRCTKTYIHRPFLKHKVGKGRLPRHERSMSMPW